MLEIFLIQEIASNHLSRLQKTLSTFQQLKMLAQLAVPKLHHMVKHCRIGSHINPP